MTNLEPIAPPSSQKWAVASVGIVVLCTLGMVVGLAFAGWKSESIIALALGIGAPITALITVVSKVLGVNAEQTKVINEIADNVNGRLTTRIKTVVMEALRERDMDLARRAAQAENVQRDEGVS